MWFYDSFLPSIFERAGAEHGLWLTRKQTAVCTQYMERHSARIEQPQGDCTSHLYYTAKWGERDVHLSYSKLNGCGVITFSLNDAEKAEANREAQEERDRIERERIERIKRNPERLAKRMSKLSAKLESAIADYEEDKANGEDEQTILDDLEWIEDCRAELAKYQ